MGWTKFPVMDGDDLQDLGRLQELWDAFRERMSAFSCTVDLVRDTFLSDLGARPTFGVDVCAFLNRLQGVWSKYCVRSMDCEPGVGGYFTGVSADTHLILPSYTFQSALARAGLNAGGFTWKAERTFSYTNSPAYYGLVEAIANGHNARCRADNRTYTRVAGSWVVSAAGVEADVVTGWGLGVNSVQLLGPWLFNELQAAIRVITCGNFWFNTGTPPGELGRGKSDSQYGAWAWAISTIASRWPGRPVTSGNGSGATYQKSGNSLGGTVYVTRDAQKLWGQVPSDLSSPATVDFYILPWKVGGVSDQFDANGDLPAGAASGIWINIGQLAVNSGTGFAVSDWVGSVGNLPNECATPGTTGGYFRGWSADAWYETLYRLTNLQFP